MSKYYVILHLVKNKIYTILTIHRRGLEHENHVILITFSWEINPFFKTYITSHFVIFNVTRNYWGKLLEDMKKWL